MSLDREHQFMIENGVLHCGLASGLASGLALVLVPVLGLVQESRQDSTQDPSVTVVTDGLSFTRKDLSDIYVDFYTH